MDILLIFSAFIAGIVMVLAPCTLPILPAYLSFLAGVGAKEKENGKKKIKKRILLHSLLFLIGFSFVFLLFGVFIHSLGSSLKGLGIFLEVFSGFLILFFGLFMLRLFRVKKLEKEVHFHIPSFLKKKGTLLSAPFVGGAFAFGWTPCIGPIVATILLLVGKSEVVLSGLFPLFAFLFGFSVPFLLLAFGIGSFSEKIIKHRFFNSIEKIGGVILIFIGLLLIFGLYDSFAKKSIYMINSTGIEKILAPFL
jgi:cytochrome c-type biogenesis protein